MKKQLLSIWVWICLFSGLQAVAQLPYVEPFGTVSYEDFDREPLDQFQESDAVILLNFRAVSFKPTTNIPVVEYYHLKRYKILTEKGRKIAEQMISLNPYEESMGTIKAATYRLNPQGNIVSYRVKRNRIKKDKISKSRVDYKFNLPVVRVGSIVEVAYIIQKKRYDELKSWEFQANYPVLRAEHHAYLPSAFDFTRLLNGNVEGISAVKIPYRTTVTGFTTSTRSIPFRANPTPNRINPNVFFGQHEILVLDNLPPKKRERFSPDELTFTPRVSYKLVRDWFFGRGGQKAFKGWGDLYSFVNKQYSAKKLKADVDEMNRIVERQLTGKRNLTDREIVEAVYNTVQKRVRWDSSLNVVPTRLGEKWEKRKADGTSINLMAYHVLLEQGIQAYPILISTLDHGEVRTDAPILDQFNHVLVGAMADDEMLLLDLVNGQTNLDLLPKRDLNQLGFMIGEQGYRWVPLRFQNPAIRYTYSRFELDANGSLKGEIEEKHRKQSMADAEVQLAQVNNDLSSYWKDNQIPDNGGTALLAFDKKENFLPETLSLSCEMKTEAFTEKSEEVMIIKPMLIRQIKENPFTQENRLTPVDLTHPLRESHLLGLIIPDGYEVAQAPTPVKVVLPNNGGTFIYNFTQLGNIIHVSSSIFLNQTLFLPREYPSLKQFFELVVSKHEEDIILVKKKK
ncbi:MAG: DUF3857 domain-containing protein [Bacteroidota bacterium]